MDIARPEFARRKKIRVFLYGAVALIGFPALTIAVYRLKPSAPSVERASYLSYSVRPERRDAP